MNSTRKLALMASLSFLMVACKDSPSQAGPSLLGPLATYERPNVWLDALISGELALESDCLTIDGYLVAFPDGETRWDADAKAVEVRGQASFVGQQARFSGGWVESSSLQWTTPPAEQCSDLEVFAVGGPA